LETRTSNSVRCRDERLPPEPRSAASASGGKPSTGRDPSGETVGQNVPALILNLDFRFDRFGDPNRLIWCDCHFRISLHLSSSTESLVGSRDRRIQTRASFIPIQKCISSRRRSLQWCFVFQSSLTARQN
jgi:hypothetical protein